MPFYARIAADLLRSLGLQRVHWVGTSMGGVLGTVCASGLFVPELKSRIATLVLNDSAPQFAAPALDRIRAYAGAPPTFDTVMELEAFFRRVYAPYGWLSDAQWRRLTETSTRRLPDGRVTPHYDPRLMDQFIKQPNDAHIWDHYDALDLPVLCLRGAESDLVERSTVDAMLARGPGARGQATVIEVTGCGHAPALNVPEQLALVSDFLARHPLGG